MLCYNVSNPAYMQNSKLSYIPLMYEVIRFIVFKYNNTKNKAKVYKHKIRNEKEAKFNKLSSPKLNNK